MAEEPEPGQRLYEAVRDMGLLTSAWGPWDSLSCEMQGDLAREEYCLVREAGPPVAGEPVCRHTWDCAACHHDRAIFFCRACLEIRKVAMHG